MQFIVKTTPEELQRARKWWQDLETQWKMTHNEAVFGKGPVLEPPKDDELMFFLIQADTLRYAGPGAINPNVSISVTNLSGLIPLYHLRYLSLTNMNIQGVRELTRFTKLQHLFLYENKLTSLEGIEGMTELENLYVQHNQLTSLKPIKKLTNLKVIYASNNNFSKIDGLTKKHANNLKKFYIQPNKDISDKEIIKCQNKFGIICRQG